MNRQTMFFGRVQIYIVTISLGFSAHTCSIFYLKFELNEFRSFSL